MGSSAAEIVSLLAAPVEPALAHLGSLLGHTFLVIAGAFALIVAVDVPFQIWDHHRQLRMTKEEVRQELKETEGDPQLKARIRSLQREVARRRMMAEVPKADVVVTNPDHYAVALRYAERTMRAPRVVAKGSLLVAERIAEVARDNGVPILRAPPLARALFAHAEVGQEIPGALYNAVAEVLAWVYQVRRFEAGDGERPARAGGAARPGRARSWLRRYCLNMNRRGAEAQRSAELLIGPRNSARRDVQVVPPPSRGRLGGGWVLLALQDPSPPCPPLEGEGPFHLLPMLISLCAPLRLRLCGSKVEAVDG